MFHYRALYDNVNIKITYTSIHVTGYYAAVKKEV